MITDVMLHRNSLPESQRRDEPERLGRAHRFGGLGASVAAVMSNTDGALCALCALRPLWARFPQQGCVGRKHQH